MQDLLTVTLVVAGLFFSITCALLLEELMFGLFFRVLWVRRARTRESALRQAQGRLCATQVIPAQQNQNWAIPISQQRHEGGGLSCSH